MIRRPAASRRAAAATTSMTMNAGTSLRADARAPTLSSPVSRRGAGRGAAERLALSSMTAIAPAEVRRIRLWQLHHVAQLYAEPGSAGAPAPPPPPFPHGS